MRREDLPHSILQLNPHLFGANSDPIQLPPRETAKADFAVERDLQRLAELELGRRGIWYLHLSPRAREKCGCPDLICCVNGRFVGVELKSPSGRLTEEQKSNLQHIANCGGATAVVRSIREVVALLHQLTLDNNNAS